MWLFAFITASLFGVSHTEHNVCDLNDTIVTLESVEIHSDKHEIFLGSSKIQTIDAEILESNNQSSLADILSTYTPVSVKSYAPGLLSTTSLRGGSASHTAFVWNGFNLQNPMNAQNDLSLLPVAFADEIQLQYGGGSAIWGSGAVGGAIIMNNKPGFGKGKSIKYNSIANTIDNFNNNVNVNWGGNKFSTSLRLFHHYSKNHYKYKDIDSPGNREAEQKYAGSEGWGLMQENHFKPKSNHIFSFITWYQQYERNIPPTYYEKGVQGNQEDEFLRMAAKWQGIYDNIRVDVRTGYFEDYFNYNDDIITDSESQSQMQTNEAELRYYFFNQNTFRVGFNHKYQHANVDTYNTDPSEHQYTLMASWRWENQPGNVITSLNFRQKFAEDHQFNPAPKFGIKYKPAEKFTISANAGKSYRLPTLNDRFWSPGGNPDLKPESGWSQDLNFAISEINIKGNNESSSGLFMLDKASLSFFHRKMNDWISWMPGDNGLWSPENIRKVRSYGAEANKGLSYQYGNFNIRASLFYSWTRSINIIASSEYDSSVDKQLTYTPKHQAGVNFGISSGAFSVSYNHNYTGRRYTTSDNSAYLDPYDLADINMAYDIMLMSAETSFFIRIHNVWDHSYEVMQSKPMPLRYFQAGFNINLAEQ